MKLSALITQMRPIQDYQNTKSDFDELKNQIDDINKKILNTPNKKILNFLDESTSEKDLVNHKSLLMTSNNRIKKT